MPQLVSEAELLWVVDYLEPASTSAIAVELPLGQNSAYVRLRYLDRRGLVAATPSPEDESTYLWTCTEAGRTRLAAADLPAAATVAFEGYFAGRTASIEPAMVLEALAAPDREWLASSAVYDALPFSKKGIRDNLHALAEAGAVELEETGPGKAHRWRLTQTGRTRLAAAEHADAEADGSKYAWLD
jgi:predicted ArsR family transcriptional regulator